MTLTVADIERWNAGDVREVFHAATSRAQAVKDAANGLAELPALASWGGVAAAAAKEAIGKTRKDLDAHGNEALAVANAARSAADEIERIKSELATLKADAELLGMEIDSTTGKVLPGRTVRNPMEALLKEQQLQPRLDKIVAEANLVDMALANAIHMADGTTPIPAGPAAPTETPDAATASPQLTDLQRANDQAVVEAAAKAATAQQALKQAQEAAATATYVHGPGSKEADAALDLVKTRQAELAAALAKVGEIPDYSGIDPNSVATSGSGIIFSYNVNGQKIQVSGTLKNGTGELFDQGTLATYTYENGKLVATRFLDPGRAEAVAEPLFTAVTAPFMVGPTIKGGEAVYLGLRGLFTKEGIEALAGASSNDLLGHGLEIATTRAADATHHLAALGPGAWTPVTESMSARAAAYQMQITGHPIADGYLVNGVKFDGYANGILTDAKGYYAQFIDNGAWKPWFSGDQALIDQARRQIAASSGTPIQWVFAEQESAAVVRQMLAENNISGIQIIAVPPK